MARKAPAHLQCTLSQSSSATPDAKISIGHMFQKPDTMIGEWHGSLLNTASPIGNTANHNMALFEHNSKAE